MTNNGWRGIDLDGTLAIYHGWVGPGHIGEPVPEMLARVKAWIAAGDKIKIFTARATNSDQIPIIKEWCIKHGLGDLEVTATKDYMMVELWDDRAVQIIPNTGKRADGQP